MFIYLIIHNSIIRIIHHNIKVLYYDYLYYPRAPGEGRIIRIIRIIRYSSIH